MERVISPTKTKTKVESNDNIVSFPSLDKQLGSLALVKKIFETYSAYNNFRAPLYSLKRSVRSEGSKKTS